jgi:hypothetical protein
MFHKKEIMDIVIVVISIVLLITLFITPTPWDKYNLYDYLKAKRLQSYNEKHKEIFLKCIYCKGTGERNEDINELMYQAKMQLWFHKHINIDRCKVCDKIEDKVNYPFGGKFFCPLAQTTFMMMMKEYAEIGPKVEKTGCSKCMGMGTFSSFDMKTQQYLTQEEYETRELMKHEIN